MSDKLYTVSLKGQLPHQPWVVINAENTDELLGAIEALGIEVTADKSVFQLIADANSLYQGVANVANPFAPAGSGEPAQVTQAATPAPARQDPQPAQGGSSYARRKASAGTGGRGGQKDNEVTAGVVPEPCAHGARTYKDGGRWKAWFCSAAKGDPTQCEPLWVRD